MSSLLNSKIGLNARALTSGRRWSKTLNFSMAGLSTNVIFVDSFDSCLAGLSRKSSSDIFSTKIRFAGCLTLGTVGGSTIVAYFSGNESTTSMGIWLPFNEDFNFFEACNCE
ncbi:CIC11C00000002649 [Sungouiella intermedia]|uniref:CIC11C00000002649 n=1 Tax=Sungouiella intermedia TaxID=45354 RepID=A0A1L0B8B2_9ASCO|nr:CIC11C00000002649 [[Candida] intermedia]